MAFDKELLDILICPKCKKDFKLAEQEDWLICEHCQLKYPIKDETPILLVDETEPLENDE